MSDEKNKEEMGKALGRIPSGIGILITEDADENPQTMLCSWFQQLSFNPPLIGVAIKKGRDTGDAIQDSEHFTLNILADGDKKSMGHFARGFKEGQDPFEGVEIKKSKIGLPILKSALAYLECELQNVFEIGDHRLYVAEVLTGKLNEEGTPWIHLRRNGFNY